MIMSGVRVWAHPWERGTGVPHLRWYPRGFLVCTMKRHGDPAIWALGWGLTKMTHKNLWGCLVT